MNKQNKTKTNSNKEQISGYQRGRGLGLSKIGEGGQLYGNGQYLDLWY